MSTAEATPFADSIKNLGDSLVNMKVLEVLQLTKYLKEAYGLEDAAVWRRGGSSPVPGTGQATVRPTQTDFARPRSRRLPSPGIGVSRRAGRSRDGDRPAGLHPLLPSGARSHAHLDLGASHHPC